ncbi:MAG: TfoX/Sxy family protein [Caldimonas sp.]
MREALSARAEVVEKMMMGGLSFMVKGHMCCAVSGKGGLLVRVGAQAREQVLREPNVEPMEMSGRTMTAFVRVAPEGIRTNAALSRWIGRGLDFVATLPAKPQRTNPTRKPARGANR